MNPTDTPKAPVVALVRDLMFASKITTAARAAGVSVRMVRAAAALEAIGGRRLLVDLAEAGAIDAVVAWKGRTGGQAVGFVSHVDAATIAAATEAGFDRVMARGTFSERVDALVRAETPLPPASIRELAD